MNDVRLIDLGTIEAGVKRGAAWFYWIAGLSLINSIIVWSGSTYQFIIGLAITQIGSGLFTGETGATEKAVGIIFNLLVLGLFVFFGRKASAMKKWAFIAGMIVYALDGAIYVGFADVLPVLFHAFALFQLFRGYRYINNYIALQEDILNNPFMPTEEQPLIVNAPVELAPASAETVVDTGNTAN